MKEYLLDLDSSYFNQYNSPKLSTYPLLLSLLATKHLKVQIKSRSGHSR